MPEKTQKVTIQNIIFEAPAPYADGHVLSAAEAAVLNQTLAENLRNNFASAVRDAKEAAGDGAIPDAELEKLHVAFADYAAKYSFSGKRQARAPIDPVLRMAESIARGIITEALRAKGKKVKDLADGKMEELISSLLTKSPDITEEARRRVAASQSLAGAAIEGLDEPDAAAA